MTLLPPRPILVGATGPAVRPSEEIPVMSPAPLAERPVRSPQCVLLPVGLLFTDHVGAYLRRTKSGDRLLRDGQVPV